MTRRAAALPLALAAVLSCPPPTAAASPQRDEVVAEAAQALSRDPVYVAPDADLADEVDRSRVADAVRSARRDFYVAVLPGRGSRRVGPDIVAGDLAAALGAEGTYVVVVGQVLRAASTEVDGAGRLAEQSVNRSGGDATAALLTLIAEIDAAPADRPAGTGLGNQVAVLLLAGLAAGAVFTMVRRRGR